MFVSMVNILVLIFSFYAFLSYFAYVSTFGCFRDVVVAVCVFNCGVLFLLNIIMKTHDPGQLSWAIIEKMILQFLYIL